MLDPAFLLDMIQVNETTRVRISVRSSQDTSATQLQGVLLAQVVLVLGVEHTVRKRLTGSNTEQVSGEASTVRVDIVQGGALLLGDAGAHGAHRQAHALVLIDQIGEDLGGGGDADAALVPQLVQPALHAQPGQPVLAVGGAAGHRAQQAVVDLDDLLDRLRRDPVAGRRARVRRHDDAALEPEGQRRRAVGDLDRAVGVRAVVGCCTQPGRGLHLRVSFTAACFTAAEYVMNGWLAGWLAATYLGDWRHGKLEG